MIDLISDAQQEFITEASRFSMYPGGEATNVALNISRLGGAAAVVASVGEDAFGVFIRQHLQAAGVRDSLCANIPTESHHAGHCDTSNRSSRLRYLSRR